MVEKQQLTLRPKKKQKVFSVCLFFFFKVLKIKIAELNILIIKIHNYNYLLKNVPGSGIFANILLCKALRRKVKEKNKDEEKEPRRSTTLKRMSLKAEWFLLRKKSRTTSPELSAGGRSVVFCSEMLLQSCQVTQGTHSTFILRFPGYSL